MDDPDDGEGDLDPAEVMELAAELLAAAGRGRLDRFFGDLVRRAACCPALAGSPIGQALGRGLAGVATRVLGPTREGRGAALEADAGHLLGLELEGLSPEDREFEAAKQLVHLAGAAVALAGVASPGADPGAAARDAIAGAAAALAPGLSRGRAATAKAASGRWVRRGDRIVVEGA